MNRTGYPDINRAALIVTIKKPFIDWIVDVSDKFDDPEHKLKPADVQTEGIDSKKVYLLPAYDETEQIEKYVKQHYKDIFEHELNDWYRTPELWPKDRSWKVFKEWVGYEIHTMIFDTVLNDRIEYE